MDVRGAQRLHRRGPSRRAGMRSAATGYVSFVAQGKHTFR